MLLVKTEKADLSAHSPWWANVIVGMFGPINQIFELGEVKFSGSYELVFSFSAMTNEN